jgi:hypothetical protein
MKKQLVLLATCVFFIFVGVPAAFATAVPLAAGTAVTAFTPTTSAFSGTALITNVTLSFGNPFEIGTVTEDVYQQTNGSLDFYYQVANNASSSDSISEVTIGNFTGFTTSIDYLTNGQDVPTVATRQSTGDAIDFDFDNGINPGMETDWLEVTTNATTYNSSGTFAVIDTLNSNLTSSLQPTPEPSSCALALVCVCLFVYLRHIKHRVNKLVQLRFW